MVHAGTGSGKTGIAAGPHVHPSSKGKVTITVSPLLALHDEQVSINKKPITNDYLFLHLHRSKLSATSLNWLQSQSIVTTVAVIKMF